LSEILLNFLKKKESVKMLGTIDFSKEKRVPVISFYLDGLKSHELTAETDKK
jgi:selenocysteine lyase/cysteine desulfurase